MKSATLGQTRPKRFKVPDLATRERSAPPDAAARTLAQVARGVLQRVPHVIGRCSTASMGPVEQHTAPDINDLAARIWRFTADGRDVYCVLDRRSEQQLLGWIVDATPMRGLTQIEHSIVSEAVKQMLLGGSDAEMETIARLPVGALSEPAWHCQLSLSGAEEVTLWLFAAFEPESASETHRPDLALVKLPLRATIPAVAYQIGEIRQWRSGSLLQLGRTEQDLGIAVYAGSHHVAAAHLGVVSGRRALRLVTVLAAGRQ